MANLNCAGNINPLYNSYFSLLFNRGTSQFELLCQRVNLPGISVPSLVQPTTLGTTIPVPSMVAAFADLSVEFIVDENMTNWKSLYSWIRNISNIKDDMELCMSTLMEFVTTLTCQQFQWFHQRVL